MNEQMKNGPDAVQKIWGDKLQANSMLNAQAKCT